MPMDFTTFRAGLWATLGLAVACGGQSSQSDPEETGGTAGTAGRGGSSGSAGVGGTSGRGGSSGSASGGSSGTAGTGVGGSAGTAGTAGTGTGGAPEPGCADPEPLLGIDGQPTGFVRCGNGAVHRPEPASCASLVPRAIEFPSSDASVGGCTSDLDCADLPYGHCVQATGGQLAGNFCQPGCVSDADCQTGQLCLCGNPVGICAPASCRVDADCGDALCISSSNPSPCGGVFHEFACEHPGDTCKSAGDCGGLQNCYLRPEEGRSCIGPGACGRPFLVEGAARTAAIESGRSDWLGKIPALPSELTASERATLSRHYSECAVLEHASVAAFARFVLDLLALGAPAELVRDATRALGDELEHAKVCFALASAYAGEPLGPGALDVNGVVSGASRLEVAKTAILEACIGETLAAAELAEASLSARPELRSVIAGIAADERRHAELGYRFLAWVLEQASETERRELAVFMLQAAYDALAADTVSAATAEWPSALAAEGVIAPEARRRARLRALSEVVLPTAQALAGRAAESQSVPSWPAASTAARSAA